MPREIAFMDALVPALFIAFVLAAILTWWLDKGIAACMGYRWVWYPALFRVAIFFALFSVLGLMVY